MFTSVSFKDFKLIITYTLPMFNLKNKKLRPTNYNIIYHSITRRKWKKSYPTTRSEKSHGIKVISSGNRILISFYYFIAKDNNLKFKWSIMMPCDGK